MSDKKSPAAKKGFSLDWLVGGVLTKIGDLFDRLTGRNWKPSSSLATSELVVRLKTLLDAEVRETDGKGRFVPHNIKLKMQWNKFSTDAEDSLKKLEYELLAAAIDHINDNRYHTYKPLKIEVKPDYFTDGVKFLASFGEINEDEAEINVTAPQLNVAQHVAENANAASAGEIYIAEFAANGKPQTVSLKFTDDARLSVGRTKENALSIEDQSVSKIHATLTLNREKQLLVADTGSTNGTFVNDRRIAYGRAFPVNENDKLKFGTIEVHLRRAPQTTDFQTRDVYHAPRAAPEKEAAAASPAADHASVKSSGDFAAPPETIGRFDKTLAITDLGESSDGDEADVRPVERAELFDKK